MVEPLLMYYSGDNCSIQCQALPWFCPPVQYGCRQWPKLIAHPRAQVICVVGWFRRCLRSSCGMHEYHHIFPNMVVLLFCVRVQIIMFLLSLMDLLSHKSPASFCELLTWLENHWGVFPPPKVLHTDTKWTLCHPQLLG